MRKMRHLRGLVGGMVVGLLALPWASAWAQLPGVKAEEMIEQRTDGAIRWGSGVVTARGIGVPPQRAVSVAQGRALAAEAAEVLARRNLLAIVKGMAIDAQQTVEDAMMGSSVTLARVSGFLKGAQVVDSNEFPDGRVEVTVAMRVTGEFVDLLLPRPSSPQPISVTTPAPPVERPAAPQAESQVQHTGLVIDARGLSIRPAIAPQIVSETGLEIYSAARVDRAVAVTEGMVGYSKDLVAAQADERVVNKPLTIKGLKAAGGNRTDIVISDRDAQILLSPAARLGFLARARVMIVVE